MPQEVDILPYLVPLLQDTTSDGQNVLYNPSTWLGEYGSYITPYDPTEENIRNLQGELLAESLGIQGSGDIRNLEANIGRTGIAGSSLESQIGNTLDSVLSSLYSGDMQSLEAQKRALRSYEESLYSQFGTLAMLGAFTQKEDPLCNPYNEGFDYNYYWENCAQGLYPMTEESIEDTEWYQYTESDFWNTAGTAGCTDPEALNYNPNMTEDDGSCEYEEPGTDDEPCSPFDPPPAWLDCGIEQPCCTQWGWSCVPQGQC